MGEWLTYLVPWWIWAALATVAVVGAMSVLASLLGTTRAIEIGAGLAAGLGALVALARAGGEGRAGCAAGYRGCGARSSLCVG